MLENCSIKNLIIQLFPFASEVERRGIVDHQWVQAEKYARGRWGHSAKNSERRSSSLAASIEATVVIAGGSVGLAFQNFT